MSLSLEISMSALAVAAALAARRNFKQGFKRRCTETALEAMCALTYSHGEH
jgi:hypothetical protein